MKLLPDKNKPTTDFEAVTRYAMKGDIALDTNQENLLARLIFCDEKIRSRKHNRDEIISFLKTRFGITQWRAEQDITFTHKLFGQTRKIDKNYVLAQHIEDIQTQIQLAKEARRLDLLPKLNDALTYALNSLPAEEKEHDKPPFKILFINNNIQTDKKSLQDVLDEVDKLLENTPTDDQYLEFEEGE